MYCVEISLFAPTASFRIPEYHTFQQTLLLPPVTTIWGILGAAAGFDYESIQKYVKNNDIKVGVTGKSQGRFKDLWKYRKIKDKKVISAVLTREFLYELSFNLYFSCTSKDVIKSIREWFLNPVYAITAGNSDDLAKILSVGEILEVNIQELDEFENTVLLGDQSDNYISNIDINNAPIMKELTAPQVYLLPSEFIFNGVERRVVRREKFTFVDIPIKLKKPIPGIKIKERSVSLL